MKQNKTKLSMVSTIAPYTGLYNDAVIRGLIANSHISRTSFSKWDTRVLCLSTHKVYFVTVAMLTNLLV